MAWLDDRAWCHPKLVNLSDRAFRVYVNGIAYAAGMGTRGILTGPQQRLLGATPAIRRVLVDARLWDELGGDISIHDWDAHNGKRDKRREDDRERKRQDRLRERPADSPQDSPREVRQERRTLKEVKVVTREANASLARAPDEMWDALVAELGDAVTKTERGKRNAALKELREIDATPTDIRLRCRTYRRKWPGITLTATALTKHWSSLEPPEASAHVPVVEVVDLPEITEEERAENLKHVRELAGSIGRDVA